MMAVFNTEHPMHRVHSLLQSRGNFGFAAVAGLGLLVGLIIIGRSLYEGSTGPAAQVESSQKQISSIKAAVAKAKADKVRLANEVAKAEMAPAIAAAAALSAGGVSEETVAYWRKQMDAFSMMSNTRLAIVGRGASKFKGASKLVVSIAPSVGGNTALTPADLAKALDFLQLYGYVESFNGTDAVVHIKTV